jgi:hypothetical protein
MNSCQHGFDETISILANNSPKVNNEERIVAHPPAVFSLQDQQWKQPEQELFPLLKFLSPIFGVLLHTAGVYSWNNPNEVAPLSIQVAATPAAGVSTEPTDLASLMSEICLWIESSPEPTPPTNITDATSTNTSMSISGPFCFPAPRILQPFDLHGAFYV